MDVHYPFPDGDHGHTGDGRADGGLVTLMMMPMVIGCLAAGVLIGLYLSRSI